MRIFRSTLILCLFGCAPLASAQMRFADSVLLGDGVMEVRVADVVQRADGYSLTLGSRFDKAGVEAPYLVLRDRAGEREAVVAMAIDPARAYEPQSLVALGDGDVLVLNVEYDPMDFFADRALVLSRFDATLDLVWSARIGDPGESFEIARMKSAPDGRLVVFGEVVRTINGDRDRGDGVIMMIDADDGTIEAAHTLGTPDDHERIVDLQPGAEAGSWVALSEMSRRLGPTTVEWADALVAIDDDGSIVQSRLIGHPVGNGIRIQPMRLLPMGTGFVIAGRRTAFGPNFFYLHAIDANLSPAASRTLVPFFNAMDADVRGESLWLYGEANGEAQATGTVLMRFDTQLQLQMQRRYDTSNTTFPTGAMTFAGDNALLALGANASDENVFVYENLHSVHVSDGQGLVCVEGDYDGFTPVTDAPVDMTAWTPVRASFEANAAPVATSLVDIDARDAGACAVRDALIFANGFESDPS